jgi:hypothetical protein
MSIWAECGFIEISHYKKKKKKNGTKNNQTKTWKGFIKSGS